jgi:Chaperone of endosialidase
MRIRTRWYSRLTLALLLSMGGLGTAFAQIENTAFGVDALASNTGSFNSAFGFFALEGNTLGGNNTATGDIALLANTTGSSNTATGAGALSATSTGSNNTATGWYAFSQNNTGNNNIGVGWEAGLNATTGSNNIEIGSLGRGPDNNVIRIGTPGTQKFTAIAGISGVKVTGAVAVLVNSKGQLGVALSSIRYKEDVHSMGSISDRLLELRPVTFRYKQADEDGSKPEQFGLIAEEVAKVMPQLVVYDEQGQPETVAYQALAPLLLNALQREHARSVQHVNDLNRQLAAQARQLKMRDAKLAALEAAVAELRRVTSQLVASRQ